MKFAGFFSIFIWLAFVAVAFDKPLWQSFLAGILMNIGVWMAIYAYKDSEK